MFRDRLKRAARKAAIRLLDMEFDTEERDPAARKRGDPNKFDASKIPKLVDGDGDTPGPNHKTEIGRTWVSAQLAGGVAPFFLDIRQPLELSAGTLPGALALPGEAVKRHIDRLPTDRKMRLAVYDQTGEQLSMDIAAWLRENGWPEARRLRGGFAEWIEHGETTEAARTVGTSGSRVGDPVTLTDGREGWVLGINGDGIDVWLTDATLAQRVGVDAIQG